MFDDTILKHMNNPNSYVENSINKLNWTSSEKSNVTTLGTYSTNIANCTGLALFNSNLKSSIKYLYLNCNSISDINALKDYSQIIELQLMCNSNLSDVSGIENHTTITTLTLHNCALSSIGSYNSTTKVYSGGLTGCKGLTRLSLQNNSGLTSLVGIEQATSLYYLLANDCNLSNIDSLANHSSINYLTLSNNTSLVSVKYIQHCKALNWIYLDNNTLMSATEVDTALNGSDKTTSSLGTTVLIKNCANGYNNIPKKYWDLFETTSNILDYSYSAIGYLENDSAKWVKLKSRTDLLQLNLAGQTHLTSSSIVSTLGNLTSLRALSLNGMSNVTDVSFISSLTLLNEIDLRGISTTITNLSVLNNLTDIRAIAINNPSIDLSTFETAIGRVSVADGYTYGFLGSARNNGWLQCGIWLYAGTGKTYNFGDLDTIQTLHLRGSGDEADLTGMASLTHYRNYSECSWVVKLPSTITKLSITNAKVNASNITNNFSVSTREWSDYYLAYLLDNLPVNSNKLESFSDIAHGGWNFSTLTSRYNKLKGLKNLKILTGYTSGGPVGSTDGLQNITSLEDFEITTSNHLTFAKDSFPSSIKTVVVTYGTLTNTSFLTNCTLLNYLDLQQNQINNIDELRYLTNINYLNLSYNKLSDISSLSTLSSLTTLVLNNNNITDLTPLVTAIGVDGISYTTLNVSNNALDGTSVSDNVLNLLKLHKAGLQKVTISGNAFTTNEINDLINGKKVGDVTYEGFGSGNVIN